MRFPYKPIPVKEATEFGNIRDQWLPVIDVSITAGRGRSPRFEAIVDSGSPFCLFHGDIARLLKVNLNQERAGELGGVVDGTVAKVYFQDIQLNFGDQVIEICAGFCDQLAVIGVLGRSGFFDTCVVTFDSQSEPPSLDVTRFHRA